MWKSLQESSQLVFADGLPGFAELSPRPAFHRWLSASQIPHEDSRSTLLSSNMALMSMSNMVPVESLSRGARAIAASRISSRPVRSDDVGNGEQAAASCRLCG